MAYKLIITEMQKKILSFQFCDDALISLHAEKMKEQSILSNIYIAKVKDIVPNIQCAFVEIKPGQKCYLPFSECSSPIRCNHRSSNKLLVEGDEILVQVTREAVKTKEPTVTTNLSLSGKYIAVTTPFSQPGYSKKISKKEKSILKEYLESDEEMQALFANEFSYIIRTDARECINLKEKNIDDDKIRLLKSEAQRLSLFMKNIIEKGKNRSIYSVLYQAPSAYLKLINQYSDTESFQIVTDYPSIYSTINNYLNEYHLSCKLSLYEDRQLSLENLYRLKSLMSEALSKKVWLKCGGYLVIEPTEALTVIDVNTGKINLRKDNAETIFLVNRDAALEIARQLRIRNISGIIIIDFINMNDLKQNQSLLQILRNELKKDPIQSTLIDMTPLGLVEITRKKIEAPLWEQMRDSHETD